MSAVDEIQAAIDNLTREAALTHDRRRIDAQLAILKSALGHFPDQYMQVQDKREWLNKRPSTRLAFELARAINGGTK